MIRKHTLLLAFWGGLIMNMSAFGQQSSPTIRLREYFDDPVKFDRAVGSEARYVKAVSGWSLARTKSDLINLYHPNFRKDLVIGETKLSAMKKGKGRIDLSKSELLAIVDYKQKGQMVSSVAVILHSEGRSYWEVVNFIVEEDELWRRQADIYERSISYYWTYIDKKGLSRELKGQSREEKIDAIRKQFRAFTSTRLKELGSELSVEELLSASPVGEASWSLPLTKPAPEPVPEPKPHPKENELIKAREKVYSELKSLHMKRVYRKSERIANTGTGDPSTPEDRKLEAEVEEKIERLRAEQIRIYAELRK